MTQQPASTPLRRYEQLVFDSARWEGFALRDDDILICTAYKAGTTWTQMICALLVFQGAHFDRPLAEISPWMDLKAATAAEIHALYAAQNHRRFIKTHTPLDGLPWDPQPTYLMVGRDPRDIFMSMLNHLQNSNPDADAIFAREIKAAGSERSPLPEDPNELFRLWLSKATFPWEKDGFPYWSVFHHTETFWAHRDLPNIKLVHYQDLKESLEGTMRSLARYLGIAVPEAAWPALVEAAGFTSMKNNADRLAPDTNFQMWKDNKRFFNKGTTGQWRDTLSHESLAMFDQVTQERYDPAMVAWLLNGSAGLGAET